MVGGEEAVEGGDVTGVGEIGEAEAVEGAEADAADQERREVGDVEGEGDVGLVVGGDGGPAVGEADRGCAVVRVV